MASSRYVLEHFLYDNNGTKSELCQKFNANFEEIGSWKAHEGTMLASAAGIFNDRRIYATGGNDNSVAIWDLTQQDEQPEVQPIGNGIFISPNILSQTNTEQMRWSTCWPNSSRIGPYHRVPSLPANAIKERLFSGAIAAFWVRRRNCCPRAPIQTLSFTQGSVRQHRHRPQRRSSSTAIMMLSVPR